MNKIKITQVYDEIVEYYYKNSFIKYTNENTTMSLKQSRFYAPHDDAESDYAYRCYDSSDKMEDGNDSIKKYFRDYFSYLMRNVFYLNMENFKFKNTFFIYERDYPIIKEILLRSVSQNEHDIIIGEWLKGNILDNDYHGIVELSERLFYLIRNIEECDSDLIERWITALKLGLRTDLAYTMTEVEFTLQDIFSYSLPFKVYSDATDEKSEMCHTFFSNSIINHLETTDEKAQNSIFQIIYAYFENVNFNKIFDTELFPPVELLQLKSACEYAYTHKWLMKEFTNSNKINEFIKYFISVDKDYRGRLEKRKENDKKRYNRKKQNQL